MTEQIPNRPPALNAREEWTTLTLVVLVAATSLSGLLTNLYAVETASWRLEGMGQDVANLLALPVLLGAALLALRGSNRGRLVWSGALLFLAYAYVVYAFDVHFNRLFLVYVAVLGLSIYTLLWAALGFDATAIPVAPEGFPRRLVAGFLVLVPLLFAFLWLSDDVPAILAGGTPANVTASGLPTNPVHVLDLGFLVPGALMTGIRLWHRQSWGDVLAVPVLVFMALTGAGIVAAMVLTAGSFPASAVFMSAIVLGATGLAWLHLADMGRPAARRSPQTIAPRAGPTSQEWET